MGQKSSSVSPSGSGAPPIKDKQTRTAQSFRYKPLDTDQIRLIRLLPESTPQNIVCRMLYVSRESAENKYNALSYCWGRPEREQKIDLDGCQFGVTKSLRQALGAFTQRRDATDFWIDAICINQDDIQERNEQVQRMGDIYSSASVVFAWLGPSTPLIHQFFGFLRSNVELSDVYGFRNDETKRDALLASTEFFMTVEYFERVWIISEIARAGRLWVICGENRVHWSGLRDYVKGLADDLDEDGFELRWSWDGHVLDVDDIEHADEASRGSALFGLLTKFLRAKCQDPHDHIFAMASHPLVKKFAPEHQFEVDYSLSCDELLVITLEWWIKLPYVHPMLEEWEDRLAHFCHMLLDQLQKSLLSESIDDNFRTWIRRHDTWNTSDLDNIIVLSNGRRVDCTNKVMRCLLEPDTLPAALEIEAYCLQELDEGVDLQGARQQALEGKRWYEDVRAIDSPAYLRAHGALDSDEEDGSGSNAT